MKRLDVSNGEVLVYGHLPMMVSAGCVQKTLGHCRNVPGMTTITDRYRKDFVVKHECDYCYNVIYNSVPLSFHTREKELRKIAAPIWRYDFTKETDTQVHAVLRGEFPFSEYTTGHLKRGVE